MKVQELVRVFIPGGILSAADLLKISNTAAKLGSTHLNLGSRQDILFPAKSKDTEELDRVFGEIDTHYEINEFVHQNIASSYVALDIQPNQKWLTSDRYIFIIQSFDHQPTLRVNVVDPKQSMVPLFNGNINFVASNQENYWYLYLRFNEIQETAWCASFLIYSEDLSRVSRDIETLPFDKDRDYFQKIDDWIRDASGYNKQPVTEELILPDAHFPYYEGINGLPDGSYWLGLYWRNNQFSIDVLRQICQRCIDTESGKISLTPWKSFVIKGIQEKDRIGWEKLMGKNGMNLRHSALELNWHLPALNQEAFELKHYLVQTLDAQDISTYGLTFTIKTNSDITPFTSIVIEKEKDDRFNILYSRDFNPNTMSYLVYAKDVHREVVAPLLIELTHVYYDNLASDTPVRIENLTIKNIENRLIYQCQDCQTIYDQTIGDPEANIPAGTAFDKLPDDYQCPLCQADLSRFHRVI